MRTVRFTMKTVDGPGFIGFEIHNEATATGKVVAVNIPQVKALKEWQRCTKGNPLGAVIPGGWTPADPTKSGFTICQVLGHMREVIPEFGFGNPPLPYFDPDGDR